MQATMVATRTGMVTSQVDGKSLDTTRAAAAACEYDALTRAELAKLAAMAKTHVVIVGAGVIGLSVAHHLLTEKRRRRPTRVP